MIFLREFHFGRWLCLLFVVPALLACKGKLESAQSESIVSLSLTGYNYTNRYIDDFSFDGLGGGNLFVSGPNGGGGGSVCCVRYVVGADAWTADIRWQVDACTYGERTFSDGTKHHDIHRIYKEAKVKIDPRIPANPKYLEVHFYPDGHVEAAMTQESSAPRLALSKDREDKSQFKQCPNDREPGKP